MAEKCDFCGRKLGKHEEIALLDEMVVGLLRTKGLITRSVPPSFVDPSGIPRWVACSKCKQRIPIT